MSNIDCHRVMKGFHSDQVTLPNSEQQKMRNRRDSGRTRMENGLKKHGHSFPNKHISQGSYAMRTMVQDGESDYDIDDGVYFDIDKLKDSNDKELTPYQARSRIKKALKDERLQYDAQIKTNCVRQNYPEGYHIDIPVYRIVKRKQLFGDDEIIYEHASGDEWLESDAQSVTRWFNDKVGELKSGEKDSSQLRRVTKLTKKFARSRRAWKKQTTSGICITKLVVDHFIPNQNRDDDALRYTWKAILSALNISLRVEHPVQRHKNLAESDDECMEFFRNCLSEALDELETIDDEDADYEKACKSWDKVFNTNYFSESTSKQKTDSTSLLSPTTAVSAGLTFPNEAIVPNKSPGFA